MTDRLQSWETASLVISLVGGTGVKWGIGVRCGLVKIPLAEPQCNPAMAGFERSRGQTTPSLGTALICCQYCLWEVNISMHILWSYF